MAVYLIEGRLGAGKTLCAVGRIRDALHAGRRVATNLDLDLSKLALGPVGRTRCLRLPDKPTAAELVALGRGTDSRDEAEHGLVVLDECAAWLNSRSWGDKDRQAVLDWLLHSRKLGWDVYFIAQSIGMLDKQVRDALVEFRVICRRMDRFRVPYVGALLKTLTAGMLDLKLPRVHIGFVRYGTAPDSIVVDRWTYRATALFDAYETRQRFVDRDVAERAHTTAGYAAPVAVCSLWAPPPSPPRPRRPAPPRVPLKPKLPAVAAAAARAGDPDKAWALARALSCRTSAVES